MNFDTLIHSGTIVTVNPRSEIIEGGWIGIRGGVIVQMEKRSMDAPLPAADQTVDAGGGLVMPGLVNSHTHVPMTLFRGLADDLPLDVWLNEHIFPAEGRWIDPSSVRAGTMLSCAELMLAGTTTICDGYFFENEVAKAVRETGLRAVLGQGVIDFPAPGVPDPSENVEKAVAFVRDWVDVSPLIRPSIFCHSAYTCAEATLCRAKEAAVQSGVLFQIHLAETEIEYRDMVEKTGMTPVGYLDHLNLLDENTLAVHGVWVDEEDISLLARRKTAMAHCPESNMKLAAGIAPIPKCKKAGITIGLGTDGCASNNSHDLFTEMDTAAKLHKVMTSDPTAMDAKTVVELATIEGARAIGLADRIGSLEPGKEADLIVIDTDQPHLVPIYNPVSQIVYAVTGADVRDVMVGGEWVVRKRRLQTMDAEEVMTGARRLAERIGRQ